MNGLTDHFSFSYAQARRKFLAAAKAERLRHTEHLHPRTGCEGEPLALDGSSTGISTRSAC